MIDRIRTWLDEQAMVAESHQRCIVAGTPSEGRRLRRAAHEGVLVKVSAGMYARAPYWSALKEHQRARHAMASLQLMHPDWVFAGPSAAVAHGLAVSNRYLDRLWLAVRNNQHHGRSRDIHGIIVSHDETADLNGLHATSFMRTVGDCLRIMDFRSGLAIADSALRRSQQTTRELVTGVSKACAHTQEIVRARATIALADPRAESGGESIARATMLELGVAPPDLQREFFPRGAREGYRVDFVWDSLDGCIVGELDGIEKYTSAEMRGSRTLAQVIDGEHRRQSLLETCEDIKRVVRFGFADVMDDRGLLDLLQNCGVPRTYAYDERIVAAGGTLRCRSRVS